MPVFPARSFTRRRLLSGTALSFATVSALSASTRQARAWTGVLTRESIQSYTPVTLTEQELTTLKAVTDRLIPSDELGPGAREAGVFVYIDRGLAGYFNNALDVYREGLRALEDAARPGRFTELPAETQDQMISSLETGELPGAPESFFTMLLNHTREGMFCDPVHGGNANFAGWDLMGFAGLKLVWTEEEQALDVSIPPAHVSVEEFGGTSDD